VDEVMKKFRQMELPDGWLPLADEDESRYWDDFYARFSFKPSIESSDWPGIEEPAPSVTFDVSPIFSRNKYTQASGLRALDIAALRAFVWTLPPGEEMIVLDWHHPCYRYQPHLHAMNERLLWQVPVVPNGDYYIFLRSDLTTGTFGHPWEQTLCVFGEPLVSTLGANLATWLPTKRVDGVPPD
jgi:hypothetical protein